VNKKLSSVDLQFIKENLEKLSLAEIARRLDCSVKTIERYKKKLSAPDAVIEGGKVEYQAEKDLSFWSNDLMNSARGRRIKSILTKDEWESFCEDWAGYHIQLDDLNHTEENNIEQIIMLKLRIDKNQSDYSGAVRLRDDLMKENAIRDLKDLDLTDPQQAAVYEKVFAASLRLTDLNKEYKELLEKSTKISESLNITRKQREEKGKIGADTFFALCKKFDSKKTRNQEGRMADLMRMSMTNKQNELRNGVEFMDGEIAPQLLDAETLRLMDKTNE
jgi:hypothetical protein